MVFCLLLQTNHRGWSTCRLIVQGSFAPPKLLGKGIMAKCHAGSASNEENLGWEKVVIRGDKLPFAIGLMKYPIIGIPIKQPEFNGK